MSETYSIRPAPIGKDAALAARLLARADEIDNRIAPIPGQIADEVAQELREGAAELSRLTKSAETWCAQAQEFQQELEQSTAALRLVEERDAKLAEMAKDWREGDGFTYILMTPSQRSEAVGVVENILSSIIGSVRKELEARTNNKKAKPPSPEGYRAILEEDLHARGWAILPMGPLAFARAAEIADEVEAQQERDNGAANTGGAAAAAAAIREAVAKYYAPQEQAA